MKRWKLLTGLLLVFVLGVLLGSTGTGYYFTHRFAPPTMDRTTREAFIMDRLSKELNLTRDQQLKIGRIVDQMVEKRHEHFRRSRPELRRIMDQGFSQIKEELNENQRNRLDALREKFERRRRAQDRRQMHKGD